MSAASWLGWYVVPLVVLISVIVFVHELGHYTAGRFFNLRIDAFSLGFGPEIIARVDKRGTRWRLAALPLGGYVNFHAEGAIGNAGGDESFQAMTPEERAHTLNGAKLYQRAIVVLAGPVANFILALVIYSCMAMAEGREVHLPRMSQVVAGSAADKAGFKSGDLVTSVNGAPIADFESLRQIASESAGLPLAIIVDRAGQSVALTATPTLTLVDMGPLGKRRTAQLGLVGSRDPADAHHLTCQPVECVGWGGQQVVDVVQQTGAYVIALFAGRESVDQLSGPIGLSQVAGEIAKASPIDLFTLAAMFSVSVGFLNLLPIPLLDGGHLLFYAIEAVARRPLNKRAQEFALRVGIAVVAFLVLFTTSHDLWRIFSLGN